MVIAILAVKCVSRTTAKHLACQTSPRETAASYKTWNAAPHKIIYTAHCGHAAPCSESTLPPACCARIKACTQTPLLAQMAFGGLEAHPLSSKKNPTSDRASFANEGVPTHCGRSSFHFFWPSGSFIFFWDLFAQSEGAWRRALSRKISIYIWWILRLGPSNPTLKTPQFTEHCGHESTPRDALGSATPGKNLALQCAHAGQLHQMWSSDSRAPRLQRVHQGCLASLFGKAARSLVV